MLYVRLRLPPWYVRAHTVLGRGFGVDSVDDALEREGARIVGYDGYAKRRMMSSKLMVQSRRKSNGRVMPELDYNGTGLQPRRETIDVQYSS